MSRVNLLIRGIRNSLNACGEFKVIGLPSEHRKSNIMTCSHGSLFASKTLSSKEESIRLPERKTVKFRIFIISVSCFCGHVTVLNRVFLIFYYVVKRCTSRCSNIQRAASSVPGLALSLHQNKQFLQDVMYWEIV